MQPQQALCTKLLESTAHSTAKAWRDFPKPILLRGLWAREVRGSGPIKRHKFKKCVFSMWKEMKVLSKHVSNSQSLETYMDIIYMSPWFLLTSDRFWRVSHYLLLRIVSARMHPRFFEIASNLVSIQIRSHHGWISVDRNFDTIWYHIEYMAWSAWLRNIRM